MTEKDITIMLDSVVGRKLVTESNLRVALKSVIDTCAYHKEQAISYEAYILKLQQSIGMSKLILLRLMFGLHSSIESRNVVASMQKKELIDTLARIVLDEHSPDEIAAETSFDLLSAIRLLNHDSACHEFLQNTIRMNAMLDIMSDFYSVFTREQGTQLYSYGKSSISVLTKVLNKHTDAGLNYIYTHLVAKGVTDINTNKPDASESKKRAKTPSNQDKKDPPGLTIGYRTCRKCGYDYRESVGKCLRCT